MGLLIHAPNVHQGGGRALLLALLGTGRSKTAILDERLRLPEELSHQILLFRVKPSIFGRLSAEWRLHALSGKCDTVLCFGNLPPLFKVKGHVVLFLQNRYLIGGGKNLAELPVRTRLRLTIERFWLGRRLGNVHQVVVQTPSMQREVARKFGIQATVLPFIETPQGYQRDVKLSGQASAHTQYDFFYAASGDSHKNHNHLLEAWCLLAGEGVYPSLCLTVSEASFPELVARIAHLKASHNLHVTNLGEISRMEVQDLYGEVRALIYPSRLESLGLPLIEARAAGLPILAAELDYVRDAVDPEECFNPDSALSIARAVKRFLGHKEAPLPLIGAEAFLEQLTNCTF